MRENVTETIRDRNGTQNKILLLRVCSPKNGTIMERKNFVYHVTIVIGSVGLEKTVNYIIGLALNPQC